MARTVKHTSTGEDIDYKESYKGTYGAKKVFFNSESEYIEWSENQELNKLTAKAFKRLWISMLNGFNVTTFFGSMEIAYKAMIIKYPLEFVLPRLNSYFDEFDWIRDKVFPTGKGKLMYLLKVLSTSLEGDIADYRKTRVKELSNVKHVDDDIFELSKKTATPIDLNNIDSFI
ncbi:MAG: hypothetical protein ACRCZ9_08505 [Fusobacteriaceae bacterium]